MSEITLSANQRIIIKAQILAAAKAANPPDIADIRATNRGWSKAQILHYAERFGVPLPAADTAPAHNASDAPETADATPETDTAPAISADTQRDLDALDRLWAAMDIAGYRKLLAEIATRANEPKTTIVQAPAAPGSAPAAKRIGVKLAGDIFPNCASLPIGSLELPMYDAPDAPAIDRHFAFPPHVGAILSRTVKRQRGVFLYGPPGTGKSTLAKQIAARLGRPFVRVSCNGNTDAATLVGMTVPSADGGTVFQPGILTHAISRPGVVLLIDEITTARDGVAYVLQSLLDDDKAIFVDECGGLVYRLAPDAMIFLADNTDGNGDVTGEFAGTRQLSSAIKNRVTFFRADYMPADLEARTLVARTRCPRALADMLVNFAAVSRIKANEGELPAAIGFRELTAWAELLSDGEAPQSAAEIAFLNSAKPDAREILQQLLTTHCAPELILGTL
jgi:cobaltochelatase CobS